MDGRSHAVRQTAGHGKSIPDRNFPLRRDNLPLSPPRVYHLDRFLPLRQICSDRVGKTKPPLLIQHHANDIGEQLRAGCVTENGVFIHFNAPLHVRIPCVSLMHNLIVLHHDHTAARHIPLCQAHQQLIQLAPV